MNVSFSPERSPRYQNTWVSTSVWREANRHNLTTKDGCGDLRPSLQSYFCSLFATECGRCSSKQQRNETFKMQPACTFFRKVKCGIIIQYFWNLLHPSRTKFMFLTIHLGVLFPASNMFISYCLRWQMWKSSLKIYPIAVILFGDLQVAQSPPYST